MKLIKDPAFEDHRFYHSNFVRDCFPTYCRFVSPKISKLIAKNEDLNIYGIFLDDLSESISKE